MVRLFSDSDNYSLRIIAKLINYLEFVVFLNTFNLLLRVAFIKPQSVISVVRKYVWYITV